MNHDLDAQIANVRHGLEAAKRLGAGLVKATSNPVAISTQEISALHFLLSYGHTWIRRIAELGTFVGHTANLMADFSHSDTQIEIYDLFEHNDMSRRSLRSHPKYDPRDFYAVWYHTTSAFRSKFIVHRGDLNVTKLANTEPLDLIFVDIVKHESLVNTVVNPFYDRLRIGGFLLHQDYYHWQSPWIVYQMELLSDAFERIEDFGNNMCIYIKRRELTRLELTQDYVDGLDYSKKYELFDHAIERHPGLRAGNLMASKLRLTIDDPQYNSATLQQQILNSFGDNERITRYVKEIVRTSAQIKNIMW